MATGSETSGIESVLSGHDRIRADLIPILQEVQDRLGFISEEAVDRIAEFLDISINDVYGVATFYAQFRFSPPGKHQIRVCQGTACHVRGGTQIMQAVTKELGIGPGETTEDREYSLDRVACFGSCALAPVVVVDDKVYGRMNQKKAKELVRGDK